MTEMTQEVSGQVTPVPTTIEAVAPQTQQQERVFTQSEVNALIGREKREAVERHERQQKQQAEGQQQQPQGTYTGTHSLTEEDIRRTTASEIQRLRDEWMGEQQRNAVEQDAKRIATDFYGKFNRGKDEYKDWDTVTAKIDLAKMPDIVQLAASVDNTHDVMYDLLNNKTKIAQLRQLAQIDEQFAIDEMQKLSNSIKVNKAAATTTDATKAPLGHAKPSNTGTDTGTRTVSDYRKNPLFRV